MEGTYCWRDMNMYMYMSGEVETKWRFIRACVYFCHGCTWLGPRRRYLQVVVTFPDTYIAIHILVFRPSSFSMYSGISYRRMVMTILFVYSFDCLLAAATGDRRRLLHACQLSIATDGAFLTSSRIFSSFSFGDRRCLIFSTSDER